MSGAVSLTDAKLFLRVEHDQDDDAIAALVQRAQAKVEEDIAVGLTKTSPAPLRLAVLMLTLKAYEGSDTAMNLKTVEAWINPYRMVRL